MNKNSLSPLRSVFALVAAVASVSIFSSIGHAADVESYHVKDLLGKAEELVGKTVTIDGFVTEVCLHRGCNLVIHDVRDDVQASLKVQQGESLAPFTSDFSGETVRISGVVRNLRIDSAYLDNWEAEVKGGIALKHAEKYQGDRDAGTAEVMECSAEDQAVLDRISALRERVAKVDRGYLLSVWVECNGINKVSGKG